MDVIVVGPKNLIRDGMQCLLEEGDIEILAETEAAERAVELAREHRPTVALVYLETPDLNAVELVARLRDACPDTELALVTGLDGGDEVAAAALAAGARACIASTSRTDELLEAVRSAARGEQYLAEALTLPETSADPVYTRLTPRERQVLKGIAEGSTSQEIADALHIRYKTVDSHRQNLARKLGASGIAELVKHAIRAGLVSVNR